MGVLAAGVPMYFLGGPLLTQFAVGLSALVCGYAGTVGGKVVGTWCTIGRGERMLPLRDALQRGFDIAWIDGELDCPEPVAEPMAGQPCVYFHYVLKDNSNPEDTATVVQNIQQFARCWIVQADTRIELDLKKCRRDEWPSEEENAANNCSYLLTYVPVTRPYFACGALAVRQLHSDSYKRLTYSSELAAVSTNRWILTKASGVPMILSPGTRKAWLYHQRIDAAKNLGWSVAPAANAAGAELGLAGIWLRWFTVNSPLGFALAVAAMVGTIQAFIWYSRRVESRHLGQREQASP